MALSNYQYTESFPYYSDVHYWNGTMCTGYVHDTPRTLTVSQRWIFILTPGKKSFVNGTSRLRHKALDLQRQTNIPLIVWASERISAQCAVSSYIVSVIPKGYTKISSTYDSARQGSLCAPTVVARAKLGCLSRAADQRANLSIAIAELGSTVSMIAGVARRIAKAIVLTRKGRLVNAYKTLVPSLSQKEVQDELRRLKGVTAKHRKGSRESWENDWLMMQYGVKPLLSDVKGLAEMAAQRFVSRDKIYTVSSSAVLNDDLSAWYGFIAPKLRGSDTDYYGYFPTTTGKAIYLTGETKFSVRAKASLTVSVTSSTLADINQVLGNPVELGYELIPLSFVADWFVNISEYIRLSTALAGLQVINGYTATELWDQWTVIPHSDTKTKSGLDIDGSTGFGTSEIVRYTRALWTGDLPALQPGPLLSGGGVLSKLVSAAALIKQRIR